MGAVDVVEGDFEVLDVLRVGREVAGHDDGVGRDLGELGELRAPEGVEVSGGGE